MQIISLAPPKTLSTPFRGASASSKAGPEPSVNRRISGGVQVRRGTWRQFKFEMPSQTNTCSALRGQAKTRFP
jgi:hypothetical protein